MTQPTTETVETVEDYRTRQAAEYGTYVAAQDIYHGGVLAYRKGQAVPVSNVELHGYADNELVSAVVPADAPAAVNLSRGTTPPADPTK